MRTFILSLVLSSISGLTALVGCSSGGAKGGTGGDAGVGATTSSSSGSSSSGDSSSSGGGANIDCVAPSAPPSRGSCVMPVLGDAGELDAGVDDAGIASITTCNPVTNTGCTGTDLCQADYDFTNYYCQQPGSPANVPICASCTGNATCAPGGLCVGTNNANVVCAPMCCDDGDCGASGRCDKTSIRMPAGVGFCVPM